MARILDHKPSWKKHPKKFEGLFESFSFAVVRLFGGSFTFIIALIMFIAYLASAPYSKQTFHDTVYDIILGITFLGFFIIQKSINKSNAAMNLKINELVASQENASNRLVNIEKMTESELLELAEYYKTLSEQSEKEGRLNTIKSIEHLLKKKDNDKRSQ